MMKTEKGSERLSRCLVNVESVNMLFEKAREFYSKSEGKSSIGKSIDFRKLFVNLPEPWYLILTEGNLLEWCLPLDAVEWFIENLRGSESLEKFRKRCQEGLFLLRQEKGKTNFSIYNLLRYDLIHDCERMGYSESRIKQITKFDDFLAKALIEESEPKLNGSPLVLLTKYVRWLDTEVKEVMKNLSPGEIEKLRSEMLERIPEGEIDLCDFVDRLNSKGVSPQEQIFVNRLATMIRIRNEIARIGPIILLHQKVKEGYSPQVWFLGIDRKAYADFIKGEIKLDWKMSLENIERFPWLSFFRTPEFQVFVEDGQIHIVIFEPQKITTQEWKKIGEVYSRFRKVLRIKRKRWGEVSGRREILRSIQSYIKEKARKIKDEDPTTGLYDVLDLLKEEVKQLYGKDYDYETLRKKLYSKLSN